MAHILTVNERLEQDRERRDTRRRWFFRIPLYSVLGLAALVGIYYFKTEDNKRWYQAPKYATTVQDGETLSGYGAFEGLNDWNNDLPRYVDAVRALNPGKVGLGRDAQIKAGDELILPDLDRNGKIGTDFVRVTVKLGDTILGYCQEAESKGDCIYKIVDLNRNNFDALGRPIVEPKAPYNTLRAETSQGVPATVKIPRTQRAYK